jgi:hypothetical protein
MMKVILFRERSINLTVKAFALSILFSAGIPVGLVAQVNIAPNATVTASDCSTGPCSALNDQNYGTCGSQLMWINTSSPPSSAPGVDWIEWNWPNVESFDEIVIHHASATTRSLTGGLIQYWDGNAWVNHHTFSNLPQQCINSITIPRLTTNRFRITSFEMTGSGQTSNPNFREIEIFSAPTSLNDAGVTQLISPFAFCPGTEDVIVRVQNFGVNQIDSVYLDWEFNGTPQPGFWITTPLDTIGGTGSIFTDVNLGSFAFAANNTYTIEAWTSLPNGQPDTVNFNDTLSVSVAPAISGNYTIDALSMPGGTNFTSFSDFAGFIEANGICGPVVVDVVAGTGPYNEQVEFGDIQGASAVNTITINGNGNTLLYSASGSADRTTLMMDGTKYFTIDSLTIEAAGSSDGWCVHLTGGSSHNTLRNCSIIASTTITGTTSAGIVSSNSPTSAITYGDNSSYTTIENNYFEGGYYAVTLNGLGSNNNSPGNKVLNNVMVDQRYYGIYARAQEDLELIGNDISRPDRDNGTILYALTARNGMPNARVMNNRIHSTHNNMLTNTSTIYAMDFRTNTTSMADTAPMIVANNQIYDVNGGGLLYGIYSTGNEHVKWYHNTISVDVPNAGGSGNTRLFYTTGTASDCDFKNNILHLNRGNSGTQHLVYVNTAGSDIEIDNNVYYADDLSNPSVNIGYHSGDHAEFTDWQSANGGVYDQNGIEFNPMFIGGTGSDFLRPGAGAVKNLGADVQSFVPVDYDSVSRPSNPDPGVYEFAPLPCSGAYDYEIDTVYPGFAEISWTSAGSVTEWQVEWDTCGFVPGSAMGNLDSVVTTNVNYQLTNLPKGVCICVYVREKCPSGGYGDWTGPVEICVPIDYDIEMVELLSPSNRDCGSDSNIVAVKVRNNGLQPATNFDLFAEFFGDFSGQISTTYTGTILPGMEDSIVIGTYNFEQGGDLDILAWSEWTLDSLPDNDILDTVSLEITSAGPLQIFSSHTVICQPQDVLFYAEPDVSSPTLQWFDINNNLIGTGDSIIVPQVDSTFTIRLAADTATGGTVTFQAGPADNTIGAGGNFAAGSLSAQSLLVEAYDDVTIVDAVVYPSGTGTLQVEIRSLPGPVVVHSFTVNVAPSSPGAGVVIPFNIQLPPGAYQFGANPSGSTVGLYRNTAGAVYPYGDPNYFEVTGNTFNVAYYYYYYNITVQVGSCERSDGILTLPLGNVPLADFAFIEDGLTVDFYNTSQHSDSVFWNFSGLGTAMGDTVSFTFPETDSFEVCMIAYGSCGSDTICQRVWANNISVENHSLGSSLQVFPNPGEGKFTLRFNQQQVSDVGIELLDLSGKSIWTEHHNSFSGVYSKDFDRGDLASGVYILRINNRDGVITRRVVISK